MWIANANASNDSVDIEVGVAAEITKGNVKIDIEKLELELR